MSLSAAWFLISCSMLLLGFLLGRFRGRPSRADPRPAPRVTLCSHCGKVQPMETIREHIAACPPFPQRAEPPAPRCTFVPSSRGEWRGCALCHRPESEHAAAKRGGGA